MSTGRFTEIRVPVGQTALYLVQGGAGPPTLVLHGIEGHEGWLAFHDALAQHATVLAPSHPGYGHTDCPDWIASVQHQAVFYLWYLQEARLGPVDLIGTGLGGWIAAYMAVMSPSALRRLVLVDAAGLRPESGETLDIFVVPWREVIARGFHDASSASEYERIYSATPLVDFGGIREAGRTMAMRMCFRPYMYDPALPGMLAKVALPTLVVWGRDDQIMPLECASLYQRAIAGATLRIIDRCGHFAHLEQPDELASIVSQFLRVAQ